MDDAEIEFFSNNSNKVDHINVPITQADLLIQMRDLFLFKLTENPSLSPNKFFDLPFKGKLLVRTYFYKKWNNFGDKKKI